MYRSVLLDALLVSCLSLATAQYCIVNETSIRETIVTKMRTIAQKPTGIFRMLRKTKYVTETYPDTVRTVVTKEVQRCCEGYEANQLEICEPQCELGCPTNGRCSEPNLCQCNHGYELATSPLDGTRHCKPVCTEACPKNSHCAEPNVCNCVSGYRVELFEDHTDRYDSAQELCVPHCNNECPAGSSCVAPNNCQLKTQETEARIWHVEQFDDVAMTSDEPLEENEKIYLDIQTTSDDEPDTATEAIQLFPSDAGDCQIRACPEHATCQQNGSCVCDEGFIWHKINATLLALNESSPKEISKLLCIDMLETAEVVVVDDDNHDWIILLIVSVVSVVAIVGVLGALRVLSQRRGKHNVQHQHDISFQYKNDSTNDSGMVY